MSDRQHHDDGLTRALRAVAGAGIALATVEYNYTPPIHFAVREGHRDVARGTRRIRQPFSA